MRKWLVRKSSIWIPAFCVLSLLVMVLVSGCATMQTDLNTALVKVAAVTTPDLQAMQANATKAGDKDGLTCATGLLALQPQIQAAVPAVKGVMSAAEAALILQGNGQDQFHCDPSLTCAVSRPVPRSITSTSAPCGVWTCNISLPASLVAETIWAPGARMTLAAALVPVPVTAIGAGWWA